MITRIIYPMSQIIVAMGVKRGRCKEGLHRGNE
jgi:hypothetical protein